jgi:hypothetical protein
MRGSISKVRPRDDEFRPINEDYYVSKKLTEQEVAKVKEAIDKIERPDEVKAKYKIEVNFGKDHHIDNTPTYGIINFWESGSQLGGDADAMVYVCPGKKSKVNECERPIPDCYNGLNMVVCPSCQQLWRAEHLIAEVFYRMPIQHWADALLYWFVKFDHDADVRVKYNYADVRDAAAQEQLRNMGGDVLRKIRGPSSRVPRLYPLRNIIKDASNGADLYGRFLAFLRM